MGQEREEGVRSHQDCTLGCPCSGAWKPWPQAQAAVRTGSTHLLLNEGPGDTTDGQLRRVAQRLAHSEAAQQSVALWEREASALPQPQAGAGWSRGCAHLQDVGEAVLELVPAQHLAVHAHLPKQGSLALQPPRHGIQQRGFPRAWWARREGPGRSPFLAGTSQDLRWTSLGSIPDSFSL